MKVLLIDVNCKGSSTGKIVYDLYTSLNNKDAVMSICYGRGPKIIEPHIYKFGLDWETYLHAALARVTGYNGCFSFFSTKRLVKFIDEFHPDVIHIHELHAYFVNIKPLINYIKDRHIPLVWTFHCEYMYTGKCGHAYECTRFQEECGRCPALRNYPKSLFFDRTKQMLALKKALLSDLDFEIVTPSQWLADRVKVSFLKEKRITVIHNGIDTDCLFFPRNINETQILREEYGLSNKQIVLAVAPNIMDSAKGGKTVLMVSKAMPEYQFVLVGADEDKRISDNVTIIKRTKNQEELAKWYSIADVFLICSKKENFPTTCLEALACGTPIVGIDEGGTKETAPAPFGLFVDNDSIEQLVDGIRYQINNAYSSEEIRRFAVRSYSRKLMCDRYLELYRRTMIS